MELSQKRREEISGALLYTGIPVLPVKSPAGPKQKRVFFTYEFTRY